MFLENYCIESHLKANSTNYKTFYTFRKNQLLEYLMQLFTWEGLPDSIPEHEIELYLHLYGEAGVQKTNSGDLITSAIQEEGPTDYLDEFTNYTWATPKHNGRQYIGVNGAVIHNTYLKNSSFPLIHATAAKLAHADSTYICSMVNGRDTVAIKTTSQKFAVDAQRYQNQKYNGVPSFIVDKGFSTIDIEDLRTQGGMNVREIIDTQQLILSEFWESIGVSKTMEKRERMITTEADANAQLLKLNISNMFNCRKKGAEEINRIFGTNISVRCNVDIDSDNKIENEKEDSVNETV